MKMKILKLMKKILNDIKFWLHICDVCVVHVRNITLSSATNDIFII